jgi:hypothetical protein
MQQVHTTLIYQQQPELPVSLYCLEAAALLLCHLVLLVLLLVAPVLLLQMLVSMLYHQ